MEKNLNPSSFSTLFIAIFLLLAIHIADAQPGINPFCKTAPSTPLCNKMVKGATNPHDATAHTINAALIVAKQIKRLTPLIVNNAPGLDQKTKFQLIQDCSDSFDNSLEDLGLSLELLNKGDLGGVGTRLSAAYTYDSDCADSLKQIGVHNNVMDKIMAHFGEVMDNTLAVAL